MQTPLISLQEQKEMTQRAPSRDVHFSVLLDSVWINYLCHVGHSSGMNYQIHSKIVSEIFFDKKMISALFLTNNQREFFKNSDKFQINGI